MLVGETGGVVGSGAGGIDEDDFGGDFAVGGLRGDHAFDDEDVLGFRDDADATDLFQTHGRHAAGGEDYRVIFWGFDDGGEALVAMHPAAVADLAFGEEAVGEELHMAGAEAEVDLFADAGGDAAFDLRGGVEDDEGVAGALAEALFNQHEGIGGGAAADIIADVHEDDRLGGGDHGSRDGFGGCGEFGDELVAAGPGAGGEVFDGAVGKGGIVIGDGEEGGAHLFDVGVIEAQTDAGREDAGPLEHVFEIAEEEEIAGLLDGDGDGQWRGGERHNGFAMAAEDSADEAGGFGAAGALIEVRVGAVGDDGGGAVDHLLGDVGVEIERDDDGEPVAQAGAEAAEDFAIGIAVGFADGGAVEGDEKGVERAHGIEGADEGVGNAFEVFGGDGAAGDGVGGEAGNGVEPFGGAAFEKAANFMVGGVPVLAEGVTRGHGGGGEIFPAGGYAEERIRFVEEAEDADARLGHELIVLFPLPFSEQKTGAGNIRR